MVNLSKQKNHIEQRNHTIITEIPNKEVIINKKYLIIYR